MWISATDQKYHPLIPRKLLFTCIIINFRKIDLWNIRLLACDKINAIRYTWVGHVNGWLKSQ